MQRFLIDLVKYAESKAQLAYCLLKFMAQELVAFNRNLNGCKLLLTSGWMMNIVQRKQILRLAELLQIHSTDHYWKIKVT